jgi:hypothetical protein
MAPFELSKLLNPGFDADPAFPSDPDPDSAYQSDADPDPQRWSLTLRTKRCKNFEVITGHGVGFYFQN